MYNVTLKVRAWTSATFQQVTSTGDERGKKLIIHLLFRERAKSEKNLHVEKSSFLGLLFFPVSSVIYFSLSGNRSDDASVWRQMEMEQAVLLCASMCPTLGFNGVRREIKQQKTGGVWVVVYYDSHWRRMFKRAVL